MRELVHKIIATFIRPNYIKISMIFYTMYIIIDVW